MSKKYKIGQVLYIVSPKSQTVVPVQVQEINQRTTIQGEETIYMVNDPDDRGPHNLDELEEMSGQVYINAFDVAKQLKDNANQAIEAMVQQSQSIAKSKFGSIGGAEDIFPSKKKKETSMGLLSPQQGMEIQKPAIEEGVEMVSVIGKDGKSRLQKTIVRITGPDGQVLTG